MQKGGPKKAVHKSQHQQRPGSELKMEPRPVSYPVDHTAGKLSGKTALVTGGDSGIGRAVALLFAKEGADVIIVYLDEHEDANDVKRIVVGDFSRKCLLIAADLSKENACKKAVTTVTKAFPKIDILVNNPAIHYESKTLADINTVQLLKTFSTNVFSMFRVTKAILPFMKRGASIINTTSLTAYRRSPTLIDYASTKGAIVSFTRSLAANLVEKGIRVNAEAPGPIETPLIASSFPAKKWQRMAVMLQ